jgi:signal transduction histidine kinase
MVGDLLFASISFGKMRLVVAQVDPCAAVRAAIDIMQPAAAAKQVELHAEFEPERLIVEADPERLQQIVWNLLSNAIKFSARGGIRRAAGAEHRTVVGRDRSAGRG